MATKLLHGSLSALNTGINYVPMGSWTLHRVQDVYNKVKDTSPGVVAKSLDRVESVVQQFIANPEGASLEEADFTTNENLQSLKLPETLTDEQLELLNQFVASMIKEKEGREENQTAKKSEPEVDTNREKPTKSPTLKSENSKLEEYSKNHGQLEKPQNLTLQQLEWSKQMMRWVTVGFFAVHTGFQDIICEMEKENDHCSKFDPRKPYYWKLTTVMARCVMDWLSKNDFLDIMMQIFNTYLQRGNTSNVSGSQPGDLSFSTLMMKAITPTVAWTSGKVDTGDEEKQKERTSLTGDLLRNYILLGRRMVLCCLMKLENENPIPQEQKESKQKEL